MAGGTTALISGPPFVKGVSDGRLAATVTAGSETAGALFGTDTGKFSGARVAEGAGGKVDERFDGGIEVDGKIDERFGGGIEVDVALAELVLAGSKADGNSGKFEGPVVKEGLKLGNCIGCCIDEGIDKPGGGRSNDCCCK